MAVTLNPGHRTAPGIGRVYCQFMTCVKVYHAPWNLGQGAEALRNPTLLRKRPGDRALSRHIPAIQNAVDQAIFLGLFTAHEVIPIRILANLLNVLPGMLRQQLI